MSMIDTVDVLQSMFKSADCKLDLIIQELEVTLNRQMSEQQCAASSNDQFNTNDRPLVNPIKVIQEIKSIRSELKELQCVYSDLKTKKDDMEVKLRERLEKVMKQMEEMSAGSKKEMISK